MRYRVNWELWISDHMLNVLRACANYAHLQARSKGRGCVCVINYLLFVVLLLFLLSSSNPSGSTDDDDDSCWWNSDEP